MPSPPPSASSPSAPAWAPHRGTLAVATLRRHPLRTALAVLGIGVAAALLLDMVMLATGMRTSFRALLLTRGYQLRVAPKGTLPFDSEALVEGAGALVAALRAHPRITAVSPSLGTSLMLADGALPSVFTLGVEPEVQGDYALEAGRDLPPATASGADGAPAVAHAVASAAFLQRTGHRLGDTLTVARGVDAQLRSAARGDMYVQVAVETPQNLTKRQQELLAEFERESETSGRSSPESEGFFAKVKEFWDGLTNR